MAASSAAVRMGKAFVEFWGDNSNLTKSISTVKKDLNELGAFSMKAGAGLAGIGGGFLAPLTAAFSKSAEYARDVGSLADQFGMTTQAISGLGAGFESAGISFESFTGILDSLSSKLLDNDALLQQFGLNTYRLARIPIDQALEEVADKFKQMTNPMQQAQLASQVFGSEWRKMLVYLKDGSAGIKRLKEAGSGLEVDPDTVKRGKAVMEGLNKIWVQFRYSILEVGHALLPTTESVKSIVNWIKTAGIGFRTWIAENKETIKLAAALAGGLVVAGTALTAFGMAAMAVSATLGLVTTIVGGIATAITSLPALLAVGGVAFGAYLVTQTETGKQAVSGLADTFASVKTTAVGAIDSIGAAISKGDFVTAFKIALTAMTLEWEKFKAKLNEGVFKTLTGESLGRTTAGAGSALALMGNDLDAWMKKHTIGFDKDAVEKERQRKEKQIMIGDSKTAEMAELGAEKSDRTEINKLAQELTKLQNSVSPHRGWFERTIADQFHGEGGDFDAGDDLSKRRNDVMKIGTSVKGGFSGAAAAQAFGYGDKTDRMIEGINTLGAKMDKMTETTKTGLGELSSGLRTR